MKVSLNEIQATAQKAVSGAGHPYGIAEEMGFAARWLCQHGLRGAEKLLHALERHTAANCRIDQDGGSIRVQGGDDQTLSALDTGVSMIELLIAHKSSKKSVVAASIAHPLLAIPFAARAAAQNDSICLSWTTIDHSEVAAEFNDAGVTVRAFDPFTLIQARGDNVTCQWGAYQQDVPVLYSNDYLNAQSRTSIADGCSVDEQVWKKLVALAHRTYVPISDQSRLTGAGAGLNDND
ncbi:MAG: DUF3726 domain-containing protein [Pseudomonadota bacterium]